MMDVRKEINFCKKTSIAVLGVVENMSGFVCPCCQVRFDAVVHSVAALLRCRRRIGDSALSSLLPLRCLILASSLLPHCRCVHRCAECAAQTRTDIFPPTGDGPAGMAARFDVPFLGKIPLDPTMLACCESGESFTTKYPTAAAAVAFVSVVDNLLAGVGAAPPAPPA